VGDTYLATVMSVKALVDSATKSMPFSPDVPAARQVQFLRLVMNAKLNVKWVDVIDWRTEKSQIQHAIAFKVFGETNEKLRPYADMLDLRRVLDREEYADMALTYGRTQCGAMIWPRILVFTSMMLRVLTPAAFGSYGAGILYS